MRQLAVVGLLGLVVACVAVVSGGATGTAPTAASPAAVSPVVATYSAASPVAVSSGAASPVAVSSGAALTSVPSSGAAVPRTVTVPPGDGGVPTLGLAPETDDTVTRIELSSNGSAVWTVRYRTRLQTDADVTAYRQFQSEFRNDTASYESSFRDRITPVVAEAATETGREMTVGEVTATTTIQQVPRRWGVVSYRFRWSGFASGDDPLRAGDVFAGGYYLAANDTLVVSVPSEYRVTRAAPTPDARDNGRLRWSGQRSFADGRPLVVAAPATPSPTVTPTLTPTPSPTLTPTQTPTAPPPSTTPPPTDSDDSLLPVVGVVAVLLAGLAALVVSRRGPFGGGPGGVDDSPGDTPETPHGDASDAAPADRDDGSSDGVDEPTAANDPVDPTASDTDGVGGDATESGELPDTETGADTDDTPDTETDVPADAATAAGVAGTGGEDDEPPEPYASVLDDLRPPLTDDERVRQLLARERGRMRQSALASELGWSASKTSRVLSAMADDDRVEKLRVGRENVVDLLVDEEE